MAIVWPADIRFGGQLGWPGGGEMPMPLRPYQASSQVAGLAAPGGGCIFPIPADGMANDG
jgi:hypothetical protein